jgi:hypothetical protein
MRAILARGLRKPFPRLRRNRRLKGLILRSAPPNQNIVYLFFSDAVTMGLGMKKVDRIQELLREGYTPRQVAERVPCSLSLVYEVRGKSDLARMRHQIFELRLGMRDLFDRVAVLEGKPADAIERLEQRRHA